MKSTLILLFLSLTMTIKANPPKKSIYDFSIKSIDGKTIRFSEFKGKKILIVNTASECGYTPQYAQLEELSKLYKDKLIVVGFPCNDFGGQEPGGSTEIKEFCQKKYGVSFLITEKVFIKKEPIHPIYQWLTQKEQNGVVDIKVKWNFHKILIDENGMLSNSYPSAVNPLDIKID